MNGGLAHSQVTDRSLERRRSEAAAGRPMRGLQEAIASLSARLLDCAPERSQSAIVEALETLGQLLSVERSGLWLIDADALRLECRASWRRSRSTPHCDGERLLLEELPWLAKRLSKFETLSVDSLADLPGEATAERAYFETRGLRSIAFVPLVAGGSLRGVLEFESFGRQRRYPREQMGLVRIAADLFVSLLERAAAERELRQSRARLARTGRLEVVGRMATGIAHDFNNLLTAILGYGELLEEELGDADPRCEEAGEIRRAAERAAKLVEHILSFSRREPGPLRAIDPNATLADLEKLLRRVVGDGVELAFELGRDVPEVCADPGRLEQAVVNLAVNGRDAMPEGGQLRISTAAVELTRGDARRLHAGALKAGHYVSIRVADTGIGMDEATRRRLFEPFFTTKRARGGTGLGLAMVAAIVAECDGRITVESRPGEGTRFEILLPRAQSPLPRLMKDEERSLEPMASGDETILIVDPEQPVRGLLRRVLEGCGYRVLEACDEAAAASPCRRAQGSIDLLVTDIALPQGAGRQLAEHFLNLRPDTRVLYTTGHPAALVEEAGLGGPASRVIEKPFSARALAEEVRRSLDDSSQRVG